MDTPKQFECPRCSKAVPGEKQYCDDCLNEWVEMQNDEGPEQEDEDSDNDEIFGYTCIGCGYFQGHDGECERCCAHAMEACYF